MTQVTSSMFIQLYNHLPFTTSYVKKPKSYASEFQHATSHQIKPIPPARESHTQALNDDRKLLPPLHLPCSISLSVIFKYVMSVYGLEDKLWPVESNPTRKTKLIISRYPVALIWERRLCYDQKWNERKRLRGEKGRSVSSGWPWSSESESSAEDNVF